jgi:threonine dehydrogenase-like Zn-dependent dehydrogenase
MRITPSSFRVTPSGDCRGSESRDEWWPDVKAGGAADPIPMLTLFDKQIALHRGQCNVKRWIPDIMPLLTDDDPLGVDTFATHRLSLDEAPEAYRRFQEKAHGFVKVQLKPEALHAAA